MASIGKCLLFYLKYWAEMGRLYDEDEPNVDGLPDPDRTLEKVWAVGDAACREVAEFLETFAPGIEAHFRPISTVERVRNNLENMWELRFRVTPKRVPNRRFEVGVSVDRGVLLPWVWCHGGRRAEDGVIAALGRGFRTATLGLDWWAGSVSLAKIMIPVPDRLDAPVPVEPLVAQVQQAFASFTADEVKAIAAIAGVRGGS